MKKDLRKCSRNFLRYCDESGDGSISVSEWIECTGINGTSSTYSRHLKTITAAAATKTATMAI